MAVDIGPRIGIDGEKEFRQELQNINQQLRTLGSEMRSVTSEFSGNERSQEALAAQTDVLNLQIDAQRQKLAMLQRGLAASAQEFGENDTRTLRWAQAVHDATADLNRMESQLQDTTHDVDDLGDSMEDLGNPLQDLMDALGAGGIGDILGKGLAIGAVVGGVQQLTQAMVGLVDETQEYRRIMGTLETSSEQAGYTAEQTADAYNRLYSVLGDTQTAATATANLQAIGLSQQQLMTIIDASVGAWARYGDSIPIDGLAESINETIRAGQVTGTFADVLNWGSQEGETFGVTMREATEANKDWNASVQEAQTAEDFFNLALQECSTEAERADLVLQAMAGQGLNQAADAWYENNEAITSTNEAQAKYEEAQAGLAERLVPVKTALTELATGGFDFLASAIDGASQAIQDLGDWWERVQPKLASGWDKFWGIESGSHYGRLSDGSYGWINGSHALGLDYVPFDGYIAQLHQGEMVLTRAQAELLRQQARMAATPGNDLTEAIRSSAEGTVNGLSAIMGNQRIVVEVPVIINGKELYRATLDDLRAVQKANPEVAKA